MGLGFFNSREVSSYPMLREVRELENPVEVATLLDTYMTIRSNPSINYKNLDKVYRDNEGYFYMSVNESKGNFDFLEFVNEAYLGGVHITSVNLGLLFSKNLSRGVRQLGGNNVGYGGYNQPNSYYNDSKSEPTGFMDMRNNRTETIAPFYTKTKGYVVGRARTNIKYTVPSPDSMIGRQHCSFYYENGRLTVEDLNSNNGTFVNGTRLPKGRSTTLNKGDIVRLVNYELKII